MAIANTLAYYDTATITAIKSVIALAPCSIPKTRRRTLLFWLIVTWCFDFGLIVTTSFFRRIYVPRQ
jgi:hypothetical protein